MKKTLFKLGFILLCVGLIVFLLLPFLETTAPTTSALNAGTSQIATENPLNAVAKKLAALFGRKEKKKVLSPASTTPNDTAAAPLLAQDLSSKNVQTQMAAIASHTNQGATRTIDLPATNYQDGYEGASFQTDDGEWVLIQQTAPEHSAPGMHEVNVHENPYDRYIRQERARHFAPQTARQEIPDSKWARFTRPIKAFLGLDTPTPVAPTQPHVYHENDKIAASTRSRNTLASNTAVSSDAAYERIRSMFPTLSFQQWQSMTPEERAQFQETQAAHHFTSLLSGDRAARESAEIVADTIILLPRNEKEQQEKEKLIEKLTQENKQRIKEGVMASIEQNALGQEPVDTLAYMIGSCSDASLPNDPGECKLTPPSTSSAEEVASYQRINEHNFYEQTKFFFPKGLPLTFVMGSTDPMNFERMLESPRTQPVGEIYQFMYDTQKCDSQNCYWVANSNQPDPRLMDAVTMTNATFKPDPKNTYPTYEESFVQYKLAQLPAEATPQERKQAEQKAREQFAHNNPNFVPYTEEQIISMHRDMLAAADPNNPQADLNQLTVPFISDASVAVQFSKLVDSPIFAYSQHDILGFSQPGDASQHFSQSMADNVLAAQREIQEVQKEAVQQGLKSSLNHGNTTINRAIDENNKNGGDFSNLVNTMKTWINSRNSGKK